jgi:hypothetical protein
MSLINENITSEGILSGNTLYAEIAEITNLVVTNFTGATTAFINGDLTVIGNTSLQALSATTMVVTTTSGVNQISAKTSTDAFRITQLGTGNTFVVQDSTNPDGSPFVIDSSGNVAIGKTSVTSGTLVDLEVAGKTIGINIGNSNTSFMAGTGIFSYGAGIGIYGIGRNDSGPVVGIKGESVNDNGTDPSTIYYGGEFIAAGQGKDYAVRLSDGTEGVGKFLYSVDTNGSANWTSQLSGTSATINGPLTVVGNTSLQSFTGTTGRINGTLIVTGDTSLKAFTGTTGIINGNLTVTGNTSLRSLTSTSGTINGNLIVTGNSITTGTISGSSLNVTTLPTLNNANSDFLTRNSATGEIERSTPGNAVFYAYGIAFAQSIGNYLT